MKKKENKLSIKKLFNSSADIFKAHWVNFILIGIIFTLADALQLFGGIGILISTLTSIYLGIGFIKYMLNLIDGKDAKVEEIFHGVDSVEHFVFFIVTSIVVGLIIMFGTLLLIVPGIVASLGLIFTKYIIAENKSGSVNVKDTIKKSWSMTKGYRWKLFGLCILIALFNVLGLFAFIIGLIATIPISMLVMVSAYRALS